MFRENAFIISWSSHGRYVLDSRSDLLRELSVLGDFQPGSISSVHRRCGKPNCHCAQPNGPGHGPLRRLTQKIAGRAPTQTLASPSAVRTAEKEIAEFRRFQTLVQQLIEVNHKICRLLPVAAKAMPVKKTADAFQQEISPELAQLLEPIFRQRQNDLDLEAVEMAVRSAMHQAEAERLDPTARVWSSWTGPAAAAVLLRRSGEIPGLTFQAGANRCGPSPMPPPVLLGCALPPRPVPGGYRSGHRRHETLTGVRRMMLAVGEVGQALDDQPLFPT